MVVSLLVFFEIKALLTRLKNLLGSSRMIPTAIEVAESAAASATSFPTAGPRFDAIPDMLRKEIAGLSERFVQYIPQFRSPVNGSLTH